MRHTYGIVDRKKTLALRPQIYYRNNDLLLFPSKDFHKWHSDMIEYIDGLYQINSKAILQKGKAINITDIDMAIGLLNLVKYGFKSLFGSEEILDFSYQYVSTMDKKYKKLRKNQYSSDMRRCDIQIHVKSEISPWLKYQNLMEIVRYAEREFDRAILEYKTCKTK